MKVINTADPYRGVVFVLLGMNLAITVTAVAGGIALVSPVLLAAAVTLGLSTGILIGVVSAQIARTKLSKIHEELSNSGPPVETNNLSEELSPEAGTVNNHANKKFSFAASLAQGFHYCGDKEKGGASFHTENYSTSPG
jgi:hypothetical protein